MRRLHTTQLGLARLLVVAGVGLWVHVHGAGAPTLRWDLMGQVIRILGADTLEVEVEGRRETIRYLGIQTPEVRYPARRKNATNATRKLVEGDWCGSNLTAGRGIATDTCWRTSMSARSW